MIARVKNWVGRHWPVVRLRTLLLATLVFVAALPGFGAIFLRVYENALVRRTEAELVAQGAALAGAAAVLWAAPAQGEPASGISAPPVSYYDTVSEIDLSTSAILPPRPSATPATSPPEPKAIAVARALAPAFAETKLSTLSSIIMLDRHGVVLNGPDAGKSLAGLREVGAALAGMPATVLRRNEQYVAYYPWEWLTRAGNLRLHYARPIRTNGQVAGVLLVSRSPSALFRGIYEDWGKIVLGIGIIFALLVVLSVLLSRAIVRPIEGLSRATRELAAGRRITPRHPTLKVVEIDALFGDFEQMADSLEQRARYLRDFASSVSHEFKTPLAAITGAIELLQDHGAAMAPAERERFLANMSADAERLSRLVRRLMELARADVLVGERGARTDAAPVIAAVADALGGPSFTVSTELPRAFPQLAVDADALEAVLTTLAENARQSGAAHLRIALSQAGGHASIDLIDDGPGIPPADRARIFDPFFTSKREQGGTGLGLAIARSLLDAYDAELDLQPADSGAHFRIRCPLA
ncbi:MAG: HAMP domain-containing sensor histidine kinase [Candidatus Andeanibacterium colombiense]|uniref:histidine kinase n=1 Tax=Candidatus Andeanibacterium colombiense TaxID=3121345 RepID=A0AAJ6BNA1_9SPHN|nr:MAG: HAMP domain-containing sensor histidine kinase [Sphingomonadaceae bacterium]